MRGAGVTNGNVAERRAAVTIGISFSGYNRLKSCQPGDVLLVGSREGSKSVVDSSSRSPVSTRVALKTTAGLLPLATSGRHFDSVPFARVSVRFHAFSRAEPRSLTRFGPLRRKNGDT